MSDRASLYRVAPYHPKVWHVWTGRSGPGFGYVGKTLNRKIGEIGVWMIMMRYG